MRVDAVAESNLFVVKATSERVKNAQRGREERSRLAAVQARADSCLCRVQSPRDPDGSCQVYLGDGEKRD